MVSPGTCWGQLWGRHGAWPPAPSPLNPPVTTTVCLSKRDSCVQDRVYRAPTSFLVTSIRMVFSWSRHVLMRSRRRFSISGLFVYTHTRTWKPSISGGSVGGRSPSTRKRVREIFMNEVKINPATEYDTTRGAISTCAQSKADTSQLNLPHGKRKLSLIPFLSSAFLSKVLRTF